MKNIFRWLPLAALATLTLAAGSTSYAQQLPGKHPAYIHALGDLRNARWYLFHQAGDAKVYAGEDVAITEIDKTIARIKTAAIDDGKDVNDHLQDKIPDKGSRLLKSIEFLDKAKADVSGEEDNPQVHQLRVDALQHIDAAHTAAVQAHTAWCNEPGHCGK
jgi:hypothetical protein